MGVTNFDSLSVTGNVAAGSFTGNVTGSVLFPGTVLSGDGAIAIPASGDARYIITKGSAAALTLPNPVAGTDDYKEITIVSDTAFAHVITAATSGFNKKGSSGTATYGAAVGNSLKLMAYNGTWKTVSSIGVTIA